MGLARPRGFGFMSTSHIRKALLLMFLAGCSRTPCAEHTAAIDFLLTAQETQVSLVEDSACGTRAQAARLDADAKQKRDSWEEEQLRVLRYRIDAGDTVRVCTDLRRLLLPGQAVPKSCSDAEDMLRMPPAPPEPAPDVPDFGGARKICAEKASAALQQHHLKVLEEVYTRAAKCSEGLGL